MVNMLSIKTTLRRAYYHVKHNYMTLNNAVIVVAVVIAASWTWGSIEMMQRNYALQKSLDDKQRQEQLVELEVQTLGYQKTYYQSDEYKDLAAREHLGLASPGEKVLLLPPNSAEATAAATQTTTVSTTPKVAPSNFDQWINFLLGGNSSASQ